jgi:hypothetical protein
MTTVIERLAERIADLEKQGANTLVPPAAILWTDHHREWQDQVASLRGVRDVLTLGDYEPGSRTGPAIWIRCMLGRTIEEDKLLPGVIPIVYLPGVAREDLRAVEDCSEALVPIAELQYRSVFFGHPNGRDWTVSAWLAHASRGAGIQLATDKETLEALAVVQGVLFEQDIETLRGRVLRASDLYEIRNPDLIALLLKWLEDDAGFKSSHAGDEWQAFALQVKMRFGLDVERDGILAAAESLADREGEWAQVWTRYADAPHRYPGIPDVLRKVTPASLLPPHPDSYPRINEDAETTLRGELAGLKAMTAADARARVEALEEEHGPRRASVWHELGETPLADALEHLAVLAGSTATALGGSSVDALAVAYAQAGWRADDAYLRALACAESAQDLRAVQACADVLYRPWVEASARAFQGVAQQGWEREVPADVPAGTCMLFCDGLRYDLAERLAAVLEGRGADVELRHELSAIPALTATGKPAATPVSAAFGSGDEFTPVVIVSGKAATAQVQRALMKDSGWQILDAGEVGDVTGRAWTEMGDIDTLGHKVEAKMVAQLDSEIRLVADRVHELLGAGWKRVVVVTDHGWLLMPEKLPKVDLPKHLADPRSGRCARLKPDAEVIDVLTLPWTWDADVRIALAPGISTFVDGKRYEHGGLSPQECVIPRLTCSLASSAEVEQVDITDFRWVGMRLRVSLSGSFAECTVDLRRKPADPASSYLGGARSVDDEGAGALLVHDDSAAGETAMFVVLDSAGGLVLQRPTVIGGEE